MKRTKATITTLLSVSALLLGGCFGEKERHYPVEGDYLTGYTAKNIYKAYMGSAPKDLNAIASQSGDVISHIANFEDCLLMNDGYGILSKSLAATATRNDSNTEFSFTIKPGIKWMKSDGTQYVNRGGKGDPQYVTAKDFLTTAKAILDPKNNSEIYYMYTLFIENAWEYYCYKIMTNHMAEGTSVNGHTAEELKKDKNLQCTVLMELIKEYSNEDSKETITPTMLTQIDRFQRVGVKVSSSGVLTYKLNQPAPFFPTMLTYTPFTPINEYFLDEQGGAGSEGHYGQKRENILYCGPFICSEYTTQGMKYVKNEEYWNKDYVHIDKVEYIVADTTLGYADQREAFKDRTVDGFSLNKIEDPVGWQEYIVGDGTGTIEKPYSPIVNSRELDDIDYTYHFVVNPNRSTEKNSYANSAFYKSFGSDEKIVADIENTNRALSLQPVRKLLLHGFDLERYNESYKAPERDQYQMNTFTPRGYVYDEKGNDYVSYYYQYFAEQKGLEPTNPEETLADVGEKVVGPQQIGGVNYTDDATILAKYPWLSASDMVDDAQKAIELYNADPANTKKITLPINIEFLGVGQLSPSAAEYEEDAVIHWNERANGCVISDTRHKETGLPLCKNAQVESGKQYDIFYMRLSNASNSDALTAQTNNGYYTLYTGWGWMGDYADPLTYVHCYAVNGEMSKMCGNTNAEAISYALNEDKTALVPSQLYKEYTQAVIEANEERSAMSTRYDAFAKVEYMLLNELYLMCPQAMYTQGYAVSVSRAAGYENPTAHYGLADHILSGMWVLVDAPLGEDRQKARDLREEREAAALESVGNNATNGAFTDYKPSWDKSVN